MINKIRFFETIKLNNKPLFSEKLNRLNKLFLFILSVLFVLSQKTFTFASSVQNPVIDVNFNGQNLTGQTDPTLQLFFIITILALAPTILIMMTCFTRLIICFHFIRSAIGTQQMPPNQVLIGVTLFLTFFIMGPTFTQINEVAIKPYSAGTVTTSEALDLAMGPMREFMFTQVENNDLKLFTSIDGNTYETKEDIPNRVLIPSFILGEITKGFIFGFIVYVPFLVIDMVVASVLMAMGMMMLPPSMISLPFKVMFFVLVDGWSLMIGNMVTSFTSRM